jgi:hypothetical protein
MSASIPGYDAWKTDSGREDDGDDCLSQCDCCGDYKLGCTNSVTSFGMDVHACPKCRGVDDEDPYEEAADRGDWECHQGRDQ